MNARQFANHPYGRDALGRHPFSRLALFLSSAIILAVLSTSARAQTTIQAADAAFRSNGSLSGTDWGLWSNGYVGTFIHLDTPQTVQLDVSAAGTLADNAWPLVDLHVANQKATFSVDSGSFNQYSAAFDLPAGTHALRVEFLNDFNSGGEDRNLRLRTLGVNGSGATMQNTTDDAVINAAADTYIENYRKGPATVTIKDGAGNPLSAGTPVQVELRRHQFHFGAAVAGRELDNGNVLIPNPAPGSDEFNYQAVLRHHFNMLQGQQAGGWRWNENVQGVPTMGYVDLMSDFAEQNGMDIRMTGTFYGDGLRPQWVADLETQALVGDMMAAADLRAAMSSRMEYFIEDRIHRYDQLNHMNETFHKPLYTDIYGLEGIAELYNEGIDTVRAAGSDATVAFNEFGVLGKFANYGEFYRQHIEDVIAAGIRPDNVDALRIDIENYTDTNRHDAEFIHRGLQNMAWHGKPMTLSEFGVTAGDANAPTILLETMRLVFGSDLMDGFLVWGFWEPTMWQQADAAAFYDANWNLTDTGKVYQQMLGIHDWGLADVPTWHTEEMLLTDASGQVQFAGFYGDYDVLVDGVSYDLNLQPGTSTFEIITPEPDAAALLAIGAMGLLLLACGNRLRVALGNRNTGLSRSGVPFIGIQHRSSPSRFHPPHRLNSSNSGSKLACPTPNARSSSPVRA